MSFLRQLWRGEVALVKTYWIFGVMASFLLNGIILLLSQSLVGTGAIWPMFVFWFISIIYTLFIAVAIWRSAGKYTGRKIWAILAKIMVVLSVLQTVLNVIGT